MSELEFRSARPEDTEGILSTLRLALGETPVLQRTPELWAWKHERNPFGPSIVFVAVDGDVIAGVRAFMRWQLTSGPKVLRCVRAVDTATHPAYRRRGIFRRLTELAVECAADDGVDLIFNTPNEKSGPGYLNMGWSRVGWIGVQARPRWGTIMEERLGRPPAMGELAPRIAENGPVPFASRLTSSSALHTPTTPEYIEWRFRAHPTASYGWIPDEADSGLVVRASTRRGRPEMVVSDILGQPTPRTIGRASSLSRARYMAGWFSSGFPRRRIAVRGGLLPVPGLRTLQLVVRPLRELDIDPQRLDSWDIATSDLELL